MFVLYRIWGAGNEPPAVEFRITAAHRAHRSCLYTIEATRILYPMQYALRFFVNADGVRYWIHGHDLPGDLALHGCISLADEQMQWQYYHMRARPELAYAKRLYEWVMGACSPFQAAPPWRSSGPHPDAKPPRSLCLYVKLPCCAVMEDDSAGLLRRLTPDFHS